MWARVIAEPLSASLKQPVVIENRGGSGGMLAAQQVARAEPDGYTILVGGLAPQIISPSLSANPGFDAIKDGSFRFGNTKFTLTALGKAEVKNVVTDPASGQTFLDQAYAARA